MVSRGERVLFPSLSELTSNSLFTTSTSQSLACSLLPFETACPLYYLLLCPQSRRLLDSVCVLSHAPLRIRCTRIVSLPPEDRRVYVVISYQVLY
jgi:hypothetical protein